MLGRRPQIVLEHQQRRIGRREVPGPERLADLCALARDLGGADVGRGARQLVGGPPPVRRPATGLVEELSPRERDVLRLLRSDLSGPDIARELLVSLNTLRTHTKHIYVKLGVANRREAVRRAAELGL